MRFKNKIPITASVSKAHACESAASSPSLSVHYSPMLVAVVTGASRGLGRLIARTLIKNGYAVAINYRHSAQEAEEDVKVIGGTSMAIKADVSTFGQVKEMAERVADRWGRVDAVINNAGISRDGLLMTYRECDFLEVVDVNLKGCFNTVRVFAPLIAPSGGGHIINISSYSGLRGKVGQAAYSASKAGVIGLTYSAAKELSGHNIRVNAVLPGYMPTGMGRGARKAMEKAKEESLLNRLSDPEEVTQFIAYLLTTRNITGQVFSLDSRV